MDDLATSLLQGLEKENAESSVMTAEAFSKVIRDLKTENPELMAAEVTKLNNLNYTVFFDDGSAQSESLRKYYKQLEVRLLSQITSGLEKLLGKPVHASELKKHLWIERKDKSYPLNGIVHVPKQEIEKIRRDYDDFVVKTVKQVRDMFLRSIGEQIRKIGQNVLPDIRMTLIFPTSSTLNVLLYYAEVGVLKADCIFRLPSITLDTNVLIHMKSGKILNPVELQKKCALDLAVTHRIRDDLQINASDEHFIKNNYIRKIPSIMRCSFDSKSKRFLLNPEFDKLGCTEFLKMAESIIESFKQTGENPPEYLDWDHIHAHYISGRDIFVTEDKKILKVGCQLKELGIRVMRFEELLSLIETNGTLLRPKPHEDSNIL